jgi:hypothetical protein
MIDHETRDLDYTTRLLVTSSSSRIYRRPH